MLWAPGNFFRVSYKPNERKNRTSCNFIIGRVKCLRNFYESVSNFSQYCAKIFSCLRKKEIFRDYHDERVKKQNHFIFAIFQRFMIYFDHKVI